MDTDPANNSGSHNDYDMVFIWDIQYITMLSKCQIRRNILNSTNFTSMSPLFCLLSEILSIVGFSNETEDYQLDNIEDSESIDLEKKMEVFPKYDALWQFYDEISDQFDENEQAVSHGLIEKCGMVVEEVEICQEASSYQNLYYENWQHAKRCLELVNERSEDPIDKKYANVVICDDGVAHGVAQLLVAGLSSEVEIQNVYGTNKTPMTLILKKIQEKFGKSCIFILVTSNPYTSHDAEQLNIPVWPAGKVDSLKNLYKVLKEFLLQDAAGFINSLFTFLNS